MRRKHSHIVTGKAVEGVAENKALNEAGCLRGGEYGRTEVLEWMDAGMMAGHTAARACRRSSGAGAYEGIH